MFKLFHKIYAAVRQSSNKLDFQCITLMRHTVLGIVLILSIKCTQLVQIFLLKFINVIL